MVAARRGTRLEALLRRLDGALVSGAYSKSDNALDQYIRSPGQSDYLYRSSQFAGLEVPPRAGFSAPAGTSFGSSFGSAVTNPDAIAYLTGSDPAAYANLYPNGYFTPRRFNDSRVRIPALPAIQEQDVKNDRLGLTGSYQWQIGPKTVLSLDGLYSRFHNKSTNYRPSA
jgi:iron complex outermembrane receptor protein